MHRVLATSVALAFLVATAAHAEAPPEEEDDFSRKGLYLGAYGVYALNAYRNTGKDYGNSPGANFRVGYRGNEWFAMEAVLEWIHNFESHSPDVQARTIIGGVNVKGYPLQGRFQPYGLIGLNGYDINSKRKTSNKDFEATDWGFRFGIGLDIYANRNWVVGLESSYVLGAGELWDADYASFGVGLQYRF